LVLEPTQKAARLKALGYNIMKICTFIFILALCGIFFYSTNVYTQDIQQSHINANLPETFEEFKKILGSDLTSYFSRIYNEDVIIDYELLRLAPTQSGIAYPKFYVWVTIGKADITIDAGAVRVVVIEKTRIEVTDFISQKQIRKEPKLIELVFPHSLCDEIRKKAGVRRPDVRNLNK